MTASRAVAAAVAAASLVLGVTSCGEDDPEPRRAPTSPATSSAATSPTTDPTLGPEDTVRAWVEAQNDAMTTGNSTRVRGLSTADCESCDGLIDPIDRVFGAGGHFDTAGWKVDRAQLAAVSDDTAKVNAAITIAAGETVNRAGADPISYKVDHKILVFRLANDAGTWRVSFVGFLS